MYFFPEIHLLICNPQCEDIWRWGLLEVLDHDGRALMYGISVLITKSQTASSPSFVHVRGSNEKSEVCKLEEGSPLNWSTLAPYFKPSSLQNEDK